MKTGDKVIVPAEISGYGRDLRAMVTEIEKFAGAIFVTVIFTEPCPEACGRKGGVYQSVYLIVLIPKSKKPVLGFVIERSEFPNIRIIQFLE